MSPSDFNALFAHLYASFVNLAEVTGTERPLHLAHYTSLEVIEKIVQNNEIWFSNPLFMNDHQEMRYGLSEGMQLVNELQHDDSIQTNAGGDDNLLKIVQAYQRYCSDFDLNHSFDVYIFCLSEYDWAQPDGRLSMWRGYGANGQGAALVFNTSFISIVPDSPLFIGKVRYLSAEVRRKWLRNIFTECIAVGSILERNDTNLNWIGQNMFNLNLMDALLCKHPGFREEEEWRIIYLPFRDTHKLMEGRFGYLRRGNTLEPKLKFPIEPLKLEPRQTWTFESIVDRVVLGPTHFSALAYRSAKRMFEQLGKPQLANKIWVSEIPYRPI